MIKIFINLVNAKVILDCLIEIHENMNNIILMENLGNIGSINKLRGQ